ncbi:MAG: hypothetical protein HOP12_10515, partial [Candidatus Eisenbacteria bacterium]|nr:hypothetical protein [Candidatus Eisenbacteria bacterium]
PALAAVASLVLLVALGLAWPQRTTRSWNTLWSPAAAAPELRLQVEPGSVTVSPGASLAVRARVWGSDQAPRLIADGLRAATATTESVEPGGAHVWRFDLSQLTRATEYRVRIAHVESPRYRIGIGGDATPVGFRIEYRAPAYARLPIQSGAAARGDLSALRGSRASVEVTFDRDLEALEVQLPDGKRARWSASTPRRWRGEVAIDREGDYELAARLATATESSRHRYRVTPLADAPPLISVRVPETDVDLPSGQQVPVDVMAEDDLGLSELKLQFRKRDDQPWSDVPLARFAARPREAAIASRWDAAPVALLPGEIATFRFVVFDDNTVSGRGMATSRSFELRFPSLAELYEKVDDRQHDAQTTLEKAAEQARELQKSLDKLARQAPRTAMPTPQTQARAEELKSALQSQQEIARKIDDAAQSLQQTLEQSAERKAFDDQLMRKMRELQELMKEIQSNEFKDAMKRMQQALEQQDPSRLESQLPKMRQEHPDMLKNLQRTIDLLKQLREEERLQALAQRADELKQRQDALNREFESPKSASKDAGKSPDQKLAEEQTERAEDSQKLAEDVKKAAAESEPDSQSEEAMSDAAAELSENAASSQTSASQSASKGDRKSAQSQGKQASQSLQKASDRLQKAVQDLQKQDEDLDLAAVRRAAQDLVALQRSADASLESEQSPSATSDQMTDLAEGAERVADSLSQLAARTPMLSPSLQKSLGRAIKGLQQSGREMAGGQSGRGQESGRQATRALNEAVLELRESESSMCNQPGNGPPQGKKSGGSPKKLGEVGQRQSEINRETRSLAQRLTEQARLSAGDQAEMRRLADEQARLREAVESIQNEEKREQQLLGRLDQTQREMKEVEEALESGQPLGDIESKQTRILSRLLDAQRSVNRRDFEPQRESRPGEESSRPSPAALSPELLRQTDRLRNDLLKAESDRYPAQYRAFIESYLKRLNGGGR